MALWYRVTAPASISNLGPGFDSLAHALNLYLEVKVEPDHAAGMSVALAGEGRGILPEDGRNWVLTAAREVAGSAVDRAAWSITSEIPIARGLGSSAAARAAGLAAGYLLQKGQLPQRHELFGGVVRTEGHPDNAAATVFGGFRVAGRDPAGNWCSWPGVLQDQGVRFLLVIPAVPISKLESRSLLPSTYSRSASVRNLQGLAILMSGLARGDWDAVRRGCIDHIHEPYRLSLVAGLADALAELRSHPACGGAFLSGSGPTIAAFLPDASSGLDAGDGAVQVLKQYGTAATVRILRPEADGLRVEQGKS
ncbi:MAG: homoserine kinase [Planctomycetes bacterium]|nr:homoserine kinase [Planctomycetota bacterium]